MDINTWIGAIGLALSTQPLGFTVPEVPCHCAAGTELSWPMPASLAPASSPRPLGRGETRAKPPARVAEEGSAPAASDRAPDITFPSPAATSSDRPLPYPEPAPRVAATEPSKPHPLPFPEPRLAATQKTEGPDPQPVKPRRPDPESIETDTTMPKLGLRAGDFGDFVERRAALAEALASSAGPARTGLMLDIAALHLARGLVAEARSFLSAASPETPAQDLRAAALSYLADTFTPHAADESPEPGADWPEWPLLPLLEILNGPPVAEAYVAPATFARAFEALDLLPAALQAESLPRMLEIAIALEAWPEARALARRFELHPGLADGSALHFLLGRVAESGGEDVAAFDSYRRASAGRDAFAQRARLAMVDLGQRTGVLEPADAAQVLAEAATLWRGDELGLATRQALADAQVAAGDRIGAVGTLADIFQHHRNSLPAQIARQRADALVAAIYADGTGGALALADFMAAHERLARDLRFVPGFHRHAEAYADRLMALGATAAAAREYATGADLLEVVAEVDKAAEDPELVGMLRLKQAEALVAGGQHEAAAAILPLLPPSRDIEIARRQATLRAGILRATGQTEALVAARDWPHLALMKADALFEDGQWRRAFDHYQRARTAQDTPLAPAAAARMVLAAHRSGQPGRVEEALAELPDLPETPAWADIAREIGAPQDQPARLQSRNVRDQLLSAGRVADRVAAADPTGAEGDP